MQNMPKGADSFIQKVAREAGDAVLKRFGKDGVHYTKSKRIWDVVTKADLLSEKLIVSRIRKAFPEHSIISEESGNINEGSEYVWVIDPIDGTYNFSSGTPLFGVMVCLVYKSEVILSVINIPATRELFFAKAGKGAYLNGKRIRSSSRSDIKATFGSGSTSLSRRSKRFVKNLLVVNGDDGNMLYGSFGSMANNACYVAAGRRDWMVAVHGSIWDFAPAYLMLKEAGCRVTDTKGSPWKFGTLEMVAANPKLHKELLKLTKNI
ncbi:inositol monophosphatase [Candidatus Parcubacteria bacterium]|nr:MAG: inositol monophosphatase [Candidatus Parcubacteria bacterium]